LPILLLGSGRPDPLAGAPAHSRRVLASRPAGRLRDHQARQLPQGHGAGLGVREEGARFLLLGYPVAFSLAFTGLAFGYIGIELGMLQPALLQALPERVLGIMGNSTLLAIPFFTLMGLILERSGMAEDLLDTIGQLFGSIRGGIAYAVVFVGALLAATTGVV